MEEHNNIPRERKLIHANKCYLSESKLYERLIIVTFTFAPSRDAKLSRETIKILVAVQLFNFRNED